ncbi:hypothetical protein HPB51_002641 [Rhipicephalus microplus]|uniref:SGF29 C-terminal domain-containing protein n=1 Tax=Rhipicephalus microplus TaxID=6941 RepID=A0A9J6DEX7_RHIMP|nr:hypothetical protein HPB51_002641 [Rhipicephalus microplus]
MQKEADYAVIQEKLRELTHVIQQCQEERNRSEHNLTNITKTHERIQQEQKLSPYYKSKLRGQYKTALQDAESEEELLRKALDIIFDIRAVRNERRIAAKNSGSVGRRSTSFSERPKEALRRGALMKMLQQNALTLPLFIGQEDEKPPPLCGAIPAEPNYVAKTTCFYRALVHEPPSGPQDDYLVLFEDSSYPEGYSPPLAVAQRYVICCKEMLTSHMKMLEDLLEHYKRVTDINLWNAQRKLAHTHFTLDDSAHTWLENRQGCTSTWDEFRQQLIDTFASVDR